MTDVRLLRRIVRDNRVRGYSPEHTLKWWENVRNGEEKYVFPFQDSANVIFNSSLAYELGVLKKINMCGFMLFMSCFYVIYVIHEKFGLDIIKMRQNFE